MANRLFLFFGGGALKWLFVGVSTGLILAVIEILFSSYILIILNAIGVSEIEPPLIFGHFEMADGIGIGLVIFLLLGLLRALFEALKGMSIVSANELFTSGLKLGCLNSIIFERNVSMSLSKINSLFAEIFTKSALFFHAVAHSIPLLVQALVILVTLFFLSFEYTLFGMLYISISGLIVYFIQTKVQKVVLPMAKLNSELHHNITRIIRNWFLIKVLGVENLESNRFSRSLVYYTNRILKANFFSILSEGMPSLFGVVMVVGFIFAHSEYQLIENSLFISFLYLFLRFVQLLGQMANFLGIANINWPYFIESWFHFNKLNHLEVNKWTNGLKEISMFSSVSTKTITSIEAIADEAKIENINPPSVIVNKLFFKYDETNENLFNDLSFTIDAGSQFALVGKSGAGKSTLLSLLIGMLQPSSGSILVSGVKPLEYLEKFYNHIGYSGTDPFLFKGTLRENLLYGNNNSISDDQIILCLDSLNLGGWLKSISFDLNYELTEGSESLSTGQKQRLSIARSLLRKAKLLILDEVSSNLDVESENELAEAILNIKGDVTIIIVSHRKNLIKYADAVLDVSHGDGSESLASQ